MSKCIRCGSELKRGEQYCDKCGTLNLQPVKRARWDWLPWAVALITAATAMTFLYPVAIYTYRQKTGYFDRQYEADIEERLSITDAENTTFENGMFAEKVRFRYPEVSVVTKQNRKNRTEDIDSIERDISKYYEGENKGKYAADYSYYVDRNNVVSILVEVTSLSEKPSSKFFVYNVFLNTGSLLDDYALIHHVKVSDNKFKKLVEETYLNYFKTADLTEWEENRLLKHVTTAYVDAYIGENGHLCFTTEIEKEDGSREAALFDTETKERLKGPVKLPEMKESALR